MIAKEITYQDFDGNNVAETFYFHLNKAELAELQLTKNGGLAEYVQTIIDSEDNLEILNMFKLIIRAAVGRRDEEHNRFVKNDEVRSELFDTDAYSELFFELMSDATKAAAFVKGIVPKGALDNLQAEDKDAELARLRAQLEGTSFN